MEVPKSVLEVGKLIPTQGYHCKQTQPIPASDLSFEFWNFLESKVALSLVLCCLDLASLLNCSEVSKLWNKTVSQPLVWSSLFESYFGKSSIEQTVNIDWKKEFMKEYQNTKPQCVVGGNSSKSFVYHSSNKNNPFVPPTLCYVPKILNPNFSAEYSHISLCNDIVFVLDQSCLAAYSLFSGNQLWTTIPIQSEEYDLKSIVADRSQVYVQTGSNTSSFDINTGTLMWDFDTMKITEIAFYEDELICLEEQGSLISLDKCTGKQNYQLKAEDYSGFSCTVIIHNDKFYWSMDRDWIVIACARAKKILYSKSLSNNDFTVHGDYIWTIDDNSTCGYRFDTEDNTLTKLWNVDLDIKLLIYHRNMLWGYSFTSKVPSFVALDAITGQQLHQFLVHPFCDEYQNAMYILDDVLYYEATSTTQNVSYVGALDAISGRSLWMEQFEKESGGSFLEVLNPNVKIVLGTVNANLVLLWHNC